MAGPVRLDTRQFMPWPTGASQPGAADGAAVGRAGGGRRAGGPALTDAAYLVGGAVRDALLGKEPTDLDWLVHDPAHSARSFAALSGGAVFELDAERRHWRVVGPGGKVHDFVPLRDGAGSVEADLRLRDLTVNAMALTSRGALIDPTGGERDLRRKLVRMTSVACLRADPIRPLRVVRFAATLAFDVEGETRAAVMARFEEQSRGAAPLPAWERVGAELSAMLGSPHAARGFALLKSLGGLAVYLPELEAGRGVQQGGFHHLDVLDHQLEALNQLLHGFPDAGPALRFAALLHDLGKPASASTAPGDAGAFDGAEAHAGDGTSAGAPVGAPTFYGHDKLGAEMTTDLLRRLRLPSELVATAASLVRYHMLPLPHGERAVRRFIHRRRELLPDLLKLMLADREAARGRLATEEARARYRLAVSAVLAALDATPEPRALLTGDDVMALLRLAPGPRVGEALAVLGEAQALGDVLGREDAELALLRYAAAQGWTRERGS